MKDRNKERVCVCLSDRESMCVSEREGDGWTWPD